VLDGANLHYATLAYTTLHGSSLRNANLSNADLSYATLCEAVLTGTNMTEAMLLKTIFSGCADLHLTVGLDSVHHAGPSALDQVTLRSCVAQLSQEFLAGVGCGTVEVAALRAIYPTVSCL
jgi:uncharacterized protein YjbI with pentapeptide repeats